MRLFLIIFSLGLGLGSMPVSAEQHHQAAPAVGDKTREWLSLQRSGQAASTQPQPIPGPVADKIYQRYQDSFSHPIPEYFAADDADASVLDN